ncbi:MAG: sigma-54 dependent transcriptional regulator [Gammaproteobacteria bacterium]|nr:sigma-54 dependent transcriptional regulator [Gammaproteobacteria bacterium]
MSEGLSQKIDEDGQKAVLLLVDDDALVIENLSSYLSKKYHVITAESRLDARDLFLKGERPQIALVDLGLPPAPHQAIEGFALIEDLLCLDPEMKILVLPGQSEAVDIQHALTLGAVDFIPENADQDLLQSRLEHHLMLQDIEKKDVVSYVESPIIGESSEIKILREKIEQLGETVYPILIEGESGTGKTLIAKALHQQSSRRERPFIYINCAAIDPELIEFQLFGYAKEKAINKSTESAGFFDEADDGTLFLDEICELPHKIQIKLAKALENEEYCRVGETQKRKIKARIIVASNKKLINKVKANKFNEDLFNCLSTLSIRAPSLSERGNDSLLLMRHFRRLYKDFIKPFTLDAAATALWMQYDFPGNVRELRNIVIRLGTKYSSTNIKYEQLEDELEIKVPAQHPENLKAGFELGKFNDAWLIKQITSGNFNLKEALSGLESHCIQLAMNVFENDLSKTADALNIDRTDLYNQINKRNDKGNN